MTAKKENPYREITVAVLPFDILSQKESKELRPAVLGFTDDLITGLSKFQELSVISPFSVRQVYENTVMAPVEKLGADYVITGAFRINGNVLKTNVRLVRTRDDKIIFAEKYDEKQETIFSIEDTVVQEVVTVLQQQIDHDLLSFSYQKKTVDLAGQYSRFLELSPNLKVLGGCWGTEISHIHEIGRIVTQTDEKQKLAGENMR